MKRRAVLLTVCLISLFLLLAVGAGAVCTEISSEYTDAAPDMTADVIGDGWGEAAIHLDKNSPNTELHIYSNSIANVGKNHPEDGLDIYTRWDDKYFYICFVSPDNDAVSSPAYWMGDGIMMVMLPGDDVHYAEESEYSAFTYAWSLGRSESDVSAYGAGLMFDPTITVKNGLFIAKLRVPLDYLGFRKNSDPAGSTIAVRMVRLSAITGEQSLSGWLAWGKFYEKDLVPGDPETLADGPNLIRLVRPEAVTEEPVPVVTEPTEKPSSWAESEVSAAIAEGLVPTELQKNYTKGISRIDLSKMIGALLDKCYNGTAPAGFQSFADTSDVNVQRASALGIITGYKQNDGTYMFKPENTLKRSEMAVIVSRIARVCGKETTGYESEVTFTDTVSHWCKAELGYPVHMGIVKGTTSTTFSPENTLTVEQTIMMVYRLYTALK